MVAVVDLLFSFFYICLSSTVILVMSFSATLFYLFLFYWASVRMICLLDRSLVCHYFSEKKRICLAMCAGKWNELNEHNVWTGKLWMNSTIWTHQSAFVAHIRVECETTVVRCRFYCMCFNVNFFLLLLYITHTHTQYTICKTKWKKPIASWPIRKHAPTCLSCDYS